MLLQAGDLTGSALPSVFITFIDIFTYLCDLKEENFNEGSDVRGEKTHVLLLT